MKVPVRLRIALASCAVFLVIIAALEVVAYLSVGSAIRSIVDHELETRLAGLDDHLARHLNRIPWPQLSQSLKDHPAFQPNLLCITDAGGKALLQGAGLRDVPATAQSSAVSIRTVSAADRALRILSVTHLIDNKPYGLVLATDLSFSAKILGRLWVLMLLSLPLVLVIGGGAGYWLSGRAMTPVSNIITAARAIDSTRLNQRIAVPETGDEIQQIAETMNGMLGRIESSFHQVRQFTANASHELRTPIAIMRAIAEVALLERDKSGRNSRDALERVLKEAERGSALLEDMLHLARIDAGGSMEAGQRKPVDLNSSLAHACADIRPLAETHSLTLRFSQTTRPSMLDADEEQLRRLWLILLDNACKYTLPGGSIRAGLETADGQVCVFVEDTGIGVAKEHLERIFERFYRVDKARSRSQGGTGLGLAIAQHIAAAHGGSLRVESEPGRGSRFSVVFPNAASAGAETEFSEASAIFR